MKKFFNIIGITIISLSSLPQPISCFPWVHRSTPTPPAPTPQHVTPTPAPVEPTHVTPTPGPATPIPAPMPAPMPAPIPAPTPPAPIIGGFTHAPNAYNPAVNTWGAIEQEKQSTNATAAMHGAQQIASLYGGANAEARVATAANTLNAWGAEAKEAASFAAYADPSSQRWNHVNNALQQGGATAMAGTMEAFGVNQRKAQNIASDVRTGEAVAQYTGSMIERSPLEAEMVKEGTERAYDAVRSDTHNAEQRWNNFVRRAPASTATVK